jgi:hypothetical protein
MKTDFLRLLCVIPISVLPTQVVHADVAPPVEEAIILPLAAVIALGLFVAIIVLVSFLVIMAIKKKHTPKEDASKDV